LSCGNHFGSLTPYTTDAITTTCCCPQYPIAYLPANTYALFGYNSMPAVSRKLFCGPVYHFTLLHTQPTIFACMVLVCGALCKNDNDTENCIIHHCQCFLPPFHLPPLPSPCSMCKDAFWLIVVLLSGRRPPLLLCTTQLPFVPASGPLVLPVLSYPALPLLLPLPLLPSIPHVELLLLLQSPVTPMLLPYAIPSQVCGSQLNNVLQVQASTLYRSKVESIGSSRHAPSGTLIDQDSYSTHCTYWDMVTTVSRDPPPTMFELGPVSVLHALQLIVVFRTCPMVISVSFLHAQPTIPPGTIPPSPCTMFLLLVPVYDPIFPTTIGEPKHYPPFPQ